MSLQGLEASSTNKHSGVASAMFDYGTFTKPRAAQFASLLLPRERHKFLDEPTVHSLHKERLCVRARILLVIVSRLDMALRHACDPEQLLCHQAKAPARAVQLYGPEGACYYDRRP